MKIKQIVLCGITISLLLFSCKKDTDNVAECSDNDSEYDNYMPLEVGNYWVYELCFVDTLGVKDCNTKYDTISVVGRENIGGRNYFKLKGTRVLASIFPEHIRMDKGEIWTPEYTDTNRQLTGDENLLFSLTQDTLENMRCSNFLWTPNCSLKFTTYMVSGTSYINLPAGNFGVRNAQKLNIYDTPRLFYGYQKTDDKQFTVDIGLVRITAHFFLGLDEIEFQLVSYNI